MRAPLWFALLALSLGACSPALAGGGNPLIGDWVAEPGGLVGRDGFAYCQVTPRMVFTPTSQTMFQAASKFSPARSDVTQVHYLVAGKAVYVSSTAGFYGAPKYDILSANEIQADSLGSCKYRRR